MSYRLLHLGKVKPSGFAKHLIDYLSETYSLNPKSILDVGCGAGGYTREWAAKFPSAEVTALDLDPPKIDNVRTVVFDLTTATLPHKFDLVFSKSVLEHLSPDARAGFIRLLKHNRKGLGVVMLPDWSTCMDVFYDDYTHIAPYTKQSLSDLLEVNGLTAEVQVFWQVPFAWRHPTLWKIVRRFWWLVADEDLRYRMKHAALLAVIRN